MQELINESFVVSLDGNAPVIYELDTIKDFYRDGERYLILDYIGSNIKNIKKLFKSK